MRASSRRKGQQYAEGGAGRDGKREKAIRVGSLAIEHYCAATSGPLTLQAELRSVKLRKKRGPCVTARPCGAPG